MLEFKFRCYDSELKMMSKPFGFTSNILSFGDKHFKSYDPKIHTISQFYMNVTTWRSEPEEVDIYEGDVLEVERYREGEFFYVLLKDIRNRPDNLFGTSVITRRVIGNIYENPELIEQYKLKS